MIERETSTIYWIPSINLKYFGVRVLNGILKSKVVTCTEFLNNNDTNVLSWKKNGTCI